MEQGIDVRGSGGSGIGLLHTMCWPERPFAGSCRNHSGNIQRTGEPGDHCARNHTTRGRIR